jgi:sirohydrochlorin ferrochelatase
MKRALWPLAPLLLNLLYLSSGGFLKAQNVVGSRPANPGTGVLLMAHGGSKEWNAQVLGIGQQLDSSVSTEVAFGMADRSALQAAVDKLVARGVTQIVAVPLFISSHSSVYDSLAFLLGVRRDAPAELPELTSMSHNMSAMQPVAAGEAQQSNKTTPIKSPVPVHMTAALDAHPIVADILADRAAAISRNPRQEVVILVAHGPVSDSENVLWLRDMKRLADQIERRKNFARVEYVTLRDDADDPVRNKATVALRQDVDAALKSHQRVLIIPLLLAYGGIDDGLRKRLDGLDHTMSPQALLPDSRIVMWVLDSVNGTDNLPAGRQF